MHAAHVEVVLRMQDRAGRVVAVHEPHLESRALQGRDGIGEAQGLLAEVPVTDGVRGGEVREAARALEPTMEVDHATELDDILGEHAYAAHTRVDGQVVATHLAQ